jgi:hypothetical protein
MKKGWLNECCKNMVVIRKITIRKKHTLESCKESASNFKKRSEWQKNDSPSYQHAQVNGWLNECCKNMIILRKNHTLESCIESASNYKTRTSWKRTHNSAYNYARKNNLLEDIFKFPEKI